MSEAVLDTNILVRLLIDAPPDMAARATALLAAAQRAQVDLVLSPVVVAETLYVLQSVYRWSRADIGDRLLDLVSSSTLVVVEQNVIIHALALYRDNRSLGFADVYVAALAIARGTGNVMTFDRGLRRLPGVTVIDDPSQLGSTGG